MKNMTEKNMTEYEKRLMSYAGEIRGYCNDMLYETDCGCETCIFNTPYKCALMAGDPSEERCPAEWLV